MGMNIGLIVPTIDPRENAETFARIESMGYDSALTFEASHDGFLPIAAASTSTTAMRLGTGVAIGFARNPMVLAHIGYDLQVMSGGRFVMGLGSQIKPHIERRYGETWSAPAARMADMVRAIRSIWQSWETDGQLDYRGDHYQHTLMTPAFNPGPNPFGPPPILLGGFGPRMIRVAAEVADGLIIHPFNSRRSVQELILPIIDSARARDTDDPAKPFELLWIINVIGWTDEAQRESLVSMLKAQLAFYSSTPAYSGVLDLHGYGDLHPEMKALTKAGKWDEMSARFPDELVDELAVTGHVDDLASIISARIAGITDSVGLVNAFTSDLAIFDGLPQAIRAASA